MKRVFIVFTFLICLLLRVIDAVPGYVVDNRLHHACAAGDAALVSGILKDDPDSKGSIDEEFEASPLFIASYYGREEVITVLASHGVDVNKPERDDITALHLAAQEGHLNVVKTLCRNLGAAPDLPDIEGSTPLFRAASIGNLQIVKLLLEEYQADINKTKLDGVSPLLISIYNNHKNTARYLYAMGADLSHKDGRGNNALDAAKETGDSTMVGFITRAAKAKEDGLNYTQFAEQLDNERYRSELEEFAIRRELQKNPLNASLYFARGVAMAKMRRDGEARDLFSRALKLDEDADFAPDAHRLIAYIDEQDETSTRELFDFVAANNPDSRIDQMLSEALRLRQEGDINRAQSAVKSLTKHLQQTFGLDLTASATWLQDGGFPLKRGSIFGPSVQLECSCEATKAYHRVASRECQATVVVETWRFVTHSYGLVGQQMILGLNEIPGLCVYVANPPYVERIWRPGAIGESQSMENDLILQRIPVWDKSVGRCPDIVIRSYWPLNVEPCACSETKTIVFGATEFKRAPYRWLKKMAWWNETAGITLITPSQWSARGFVNDGVHPELIRIVPHAVDAAAFHPAVAAKEELNTRSLQGWDDETFVLIHIGSMLDRKGFKELVAAFSQLQEWFKTTGSTKYCIKRKSTDEKCVNKLKLVLKGSDRVANSIALIDNFERNGLNGSNFRSLFESGAVEYIGRQLDSKGVASLLKASDLYVSSYKAGT